MKKVLALVIIILITIKVNAQQHAFGMKFDNTKYSLAPRLSVGGKAEVTLPFVSLKKYTPFPGNQGQCGSCVGWASGYANLSTNWAIVNNITDRQQITDNARSGMFLYVQIADNCESGSLIPDALKVAQQTGDCLLKDFNPPSYNRDGLDNAKSKASLHVKDFSAIWDISADDKTKIDNTRLSLQNNKPVIIGANVYRSFEALNKSNYLWQPDVVNESPIGGHAMCVVGYDDFKNQFEIMNSWGGDFGNDGYFNISYADYAKVVKYGFNVTIDDRKNPEVDPIAVNGEFQLDHITGYDASGEKLVSQEVTPQLNSDKEYVVTGGINQNDFYRLFARNIKKDCYVYAFSIDPNKKAEVLYPFSNNIGFRAQRKLGATVVEVPRVYSGEEIEIPGDNHAIKFDVNGTDNIVILYSFNQITDIVSLANSVNNAAGSNMMQKLQAALGSRLMPADNLTYSDGRMRVSGTSQTGDIVPIILKMQVGQTSGVRKRRVIGH